MSILLWKIDPELIILSPIDTGSCTDLNAVSMQIPLGCYTTFRIYPGGKVLVFEQHIKRLEESAQLSNTSITINNKRIRKMIRSLIPTLDKSWRVRITVDLTKQPGEIYVAIAAMPVIPDHCYSEGIVVSLVNLIRDNPQAKLSDFIKQTSVADKGMSGLSEELLLIDPTGNILEGASSNFFAVINGAVHTAAENVLAGTTKNIVQDIIYSNSIPMIMDPININNIGGIQEAFITSVSRGIMPIRQIDEKWISDISPGPLTKRLMGLYSHFLSTHLEYL